MSTALEKRARRATPSPPSDRRRSVGRLDACDIERGVRTFVEVGPGKVLCGLMRQIDRSKTCVNVEDESSLSKTLEKL